MGGSWSKKSETPFRFTAFKISFDQKQTDRKSTSKKSFHLQNMCLKPLFFAVGKDHMRGREKNENLGILLKKTIRKNVFRHVCIEAQERVSRNLAH